MPRKAREQSATGCYHIMGRGINHTAIYNDDADNMNFLHILDFVRTKILQFLRIA